jgi:sugar-specific transcriptional regulator TrmB
VHETLAALGLNQSDANVYVFLAKTGPHKGKDLCNALNMPKPRLYQCLSKLKSKGAVSVTPERPAIFSAVPFEKVLDILVKAKMEEAQHTQQDKDEALSDWKLIIEAESNKKP